MLGSAQCIREMEITNWLLRNVYGKAHVPAKRLVLDAAEAPALKDWLSAIGGEFGTTAVAPMPLTTLDQAIGVTHPLITVADFRAQYANAGYPDMFHPTHLPEVAEVKKAMRPVLVPRHAPDALYDKVLHGIIIPHRFFDFLHVRGICVLAGQKARGLCDLMPVGTTEFDDLFGAGGNPRAGLLSFANSRDSAVRRYARESVLSRATFILVRHVRPDELAVSLLTLRALSRELRETVGLVLCLDGGVPASPDNGMTWIVDDDFQPEEPVAVAASARVPPQIARAAAWIKQSPYNEVRVAALSHMREMQRKAAIGAYA